MTFEEFKAIAMNPPYTPEPAVYRIDVYRIIEREYYPEYLVSKSQSFILPTFEDAIQFIKDDYISKDDHRSVYCIRIYELPFGKDIVNYLCKREWVFDGKCNIVNQSACSSLMEDLDKPEGHFWGRPKESIRFKPGDVVEVHDRENGVVRLAVVVSLHNVIDTCWRDYQDTVKLCEIEGIGVEFADDNYSRYACDDCFGVVYGLNPIEYSYPYTTDVFTPRFPIPEKLREYLNECYSIAIKALSNESNALNKQDKPL